MELWIRSQDKLVLTRNAGLRIVIEQEGASIIDETNDYILGMYKTIYRALEVLNEIQKIVGWIQKDFKGVTAGDIYDLDGHYLNYVYEMPEE